MSHVTHCVEKKKDGVKKTTKRRRRKGKCQRRREREGRRGGIPIFLITQGFNGGCVNDTLKNNQQKIPSFFLLLHFSFFSPSFLLLLSPLFMVQPVSL
jgi:hypothetical protein